MKIEIRLDNKTFQIAALNIDPEGREDLRPYAVACAEIMVKNLAMSIKKLRKG